MLNADYDHEEALDALMCAINQLVEHRDETVRTAVRVAVCFTIAAVRDTPELMGVLVKGLPLNTDVSLGLDVEYVIDGLAQIFTDTIMGHLAEVRLSRIVEDAMMEE